MENKKPTVLNTNVSYEQMSNKEGKRTLPIWPNINVHNVRIRPEISK